MPSCIPYAHGVPAAAGPPIWWDTTSGPAPVLNQRVDDPRWIGARSIAYPNAGGIASGEHAVFRALHHTEAGASSLYLSWWVKVNPAVDNTFDRVFLGLWSGAAAQTPLGIQVRVFGPGSPAPGASWQQRVPAGTDLLEHTGGAWGLAAGSANWANGNPGRTRVWTRTGQFAVAMHVPLLAAGNYDDSGINLGALGADFRLWYLVQTSTGGGAVQFFWPRTSTLPGGSPPDPNTWDTFKALDDPNCGAGVRLSVTDVLTTNVPPHEIKFKRTPGPKPVNTFIARPENKTTALITAGAVQARFRLANWGSQPDWNQVANPATLWQEVPADAGTLNPCVNDVAIQVNGFGNCTFNWTLSDADITPFDTPAGNPERRAHQCMLVQLEGPGLEFITPSVYRNMDLVQASEFTRDADVSVAGLGSLGDPERTVYLYLQLTNMPEKLDPPTGVEGEGPQFEREYAARVDDGKGDQDSATPMDHIAERLPTYRIHVFHDTGETTEQDGETLAVLAPQTSFGYVVAHSGPLFGWTPLLTGPGLTQIAPDFYRLEVPVDGAVTVTTSITAHEEPRPDRPGGCWGRLRDLFGGS